jgi:hypothetical protein
VLLDGVGGCGGDAAQATLAHTNLQLEVTLLTPGTWSQEKVENIRGYNGVYEARAQTGNTH